MPYAEVNDIRMYYEEEGQGGALAERLERRQRQAWERMPMKRWADPTRPQRVSPSPHAGPESRA